MHEAEVGANGRMAVYIKKGETERGVSTLEIRE